MLILLGFAFLAGVVTVLSPCILPVLPVVLASALGTQRFRPLGVVTGLVASFTVFTLALTSLVALVGISPDALRLGGALVIGLFGLVLVLPSLLARFETLTSRLANLGGPHQAGGGYWGGVLLGGSLGLVWAPCAGPILAAITTLVATSQLSLTAVAITFTYGLGVGVPMLLIAYGGRRIITRARGLNRYAARLQRAFGAIMVAFAFTFFLGLDRAVTTALTQSVPPEWTQALTSLEDQPSVRSALASLQGRAAPAGAAPTVTATAPTAVLAGPRADLPDLGPAPELAGIVGWINGEPTTLAALRGRVVLIDFWTYSCINCIRTLPHVTAWDQTYRDRGLVVIGVHTPEFEFEKSRDNVALAAQQQGIKYLVAQDNNYATWQAFGNLYWPAKYIIDAQGHLRYHHFGEGQYAETEKVIQDLL
jgi:cytochrome c biogenesis protein CcdA/thiol-disulfide isomerase/thioredoxin